MHSDRGCLVPKTSAVIILGSFFGLQVKVMPLYKYKDRFDTYRSMFKSYINSNFKSPPNHSRVSYNCNRFILATITA